MSQAHRAAINGAGTQAAWVLPATKSVSTYHGESGRDRDKRRGTIGWRGGSKTTRAAPEFSSER